MVRIWKSFRRSEHLIFFRHCRLPLLAGPTPQPSFSVEWFVSAQFEELPWSTATMFSRYKVRSRFRSFQFCDGCRLSALGTHRPLSSTSCSCHLSNQFSRRVVSSDELHGCHCHSWLHALYLLRERPTINRRFFTEECTAVIMIHILKNLYSTVSMFLFWLYTKGIQIYPLPVHRSILFLSSVIFHSRLPSQNPSVCALLQRTFSVCVYRVPGGWQHFPTDFF